MKKEIKGQAVKGVMPKLPPFKLFTFPEVRRGLGLTQKNIADLFDVTVVTVQAWENGRKNPSGTSGRLLSMFMTDPRATIALLEESKKHSFFYTHLTALERKKHYGRCTLTEIPHGPFI